MCDCWTVSSGKLNLLNYTTVRLIRYPERNLNWSRIGSKNPLKAISMKWNTFLDASKRKLLSNFFFLHRWGKWCVWEKATTQQSIQWLYRSKVSYIHRVAMTNNQFWTILHTHYGGATGMRYFEDPRSVGCLAICESQKYVFDWTNKCKIWHKQTSPNVVFGALVICIDNA